jgi:RimJ/RimL family protein N-acetyltransferase
MQSTIATPQRTPGALVLGDSTELTVRPLRTGERGVVEALFARLGELSRWRRFGTAKPVLRPAEVDQLAAVDDRDHVALVAFDPRACEPVAVARYVRDETAPAVAEIAFEVADAWQRRGVGTALVAALAQRAAESGIRCFRATIRSENRAAISLVSRLGRVCRTEWSGPELELAVDLA